MPLLFFDDSRYYSDAAFYANHFAWPAAGGAGERLAYHGYWSGRLNAHHELCLKSLLITQSPPYEVVVWMPSGDLVRNAAFIDSFADVPNLEFRPYLPEREASGTRFEAHVDLLRDERPPPPDPRLRGNPALGKARAISDGLRLLVLERYGGIYFDFDTLFLRDLRPLTTVDFVYQWSNQPYGSNAICHFRRGSPALGALAERSTRLGSCHPARLLRFDELGALPGALQIFPSFAFDPIWIAHDTGARVHAACNRFDDFFTSRAPTTLADFFPAAYAYDWHNRWQLPLRRASIAGQLHEEVCRRFAAAGRPASSNVARGPSEGEAAP
jgi:hypothetical protein